MSDECSLESEISDYTPSETYNADIPIVKDGLYTEQELNSPGTPTGREYDPDKAPPSDGHYTDNNL